MSEDATEYKAETKVLAKSNREWLQGEEFKSAVAQVLPRHMTPERFVRAGVMAITRTPKLAKCDQPSFLKCMMDLSMLGLEPDGRWAHLIPFENKKRGVIECQLIVDYKGLVQLAMRSGEISYIHADVVCENDDFEYDRGEISRHKIDMRKPRGAIYAAYALAQFRDGTRKCEVMSRDDVEAVRARSRAANSGPWVTDYAEMCKKTVLRRLSKWLPMSSETLEKISEHEDRPVRDVTPISDSLDDLAEALGDE